MIKKRKSILYIVRLDSYQSHRGQIIKPYIIPVFIYKPFKDNFSKINHTNENYKRKWIRYICYMIVFNMENNFNMEDIFVVYICIFFQNDNIIL